MTKIMDETKAAVRAIFAPTKKMLTGGRLEYTFTATCYACGARRSIKGPDNYRLHALFTKFSHIGWVKKNAHQLTCPSCIKRRVVRTGPSRGTEEDHTEMTTQPMNGAAEAPALSPDQKAKLRALLDRYFDDAKGFYLDGYSDQRIGTETGLPFAAVGRYREIAYGPIKEDPDLAVIKTELAKVDALVAGIRDKVAKVEKRLGL